MCAKVLVIVIIIIDNLHNAKSDIMLSNVLDQEGIVQDKSRADIKAKSVHQRSLVWRIG